MSGLFPAQKFEQVGCQLFFVRGEQTVRRAVVFNQLGIGDTFDCRPRAGIYRNGLIGSAVDNQRRHCKGFQIRTEIRRRKGFGAIERCLETRLHRHVPGRFEQFVADRM